MIWQSLLLTGLAIVVIYFVHAGFKYTRMINNIFLSLVYQPVVEPLSGFRGEKVVILDSSDKEIEALLTEKAGAKRIAIFCHESGLGKESWEKYAYFLPDLGYHVLSVDMGPAKEEDQKNSLSQWPTGEDLARLRTVIRWVKKAFRTDIPIVLFGVSHGADLALAGSFEDPNVKAVVADGLFSMKEIFRDYIRKWAPILVKPNLFGENYPFWVVNIFANLGFWYCQKKSKRRFVDVECLLASKHVPLLMIHGEEDDYAPLSHQNYLEKINRDKKNFQRFVVPKARHNQAVQVSRVDYESQIAKFLIRVLG